MKTNHWLIAAVVTVVLMAGLCPAFAFADSGDDLLAGEPRLVVQADDDITSGTCGTCTWTIDADGNLVIRPTSGNVGELGTWNFNEAPWCLEYDYGHVVTSARFEGTVKAKTCASMFYGCGEMKSIDLSGLDTSDAESMDAMFAGCGSLTSLDLSPLDTSKVTDMREMFAACMSLATIDLSPLNTSKVTDMCAMFSDCRALAFLDLSPLDTSEVADMSGMFQNCCCLTSIDLSLLDTSKVTDMGSMFFGCELLTSIDLSPLETSKVQSMDDMFNGCKFVETIYVSDLWTTENVTHSQDMFTGCELLVGGNGTIFNPSKTDAEYARVDSAETPGYLTHKSSGDHGSNVNNELDFSTDVWDFKNYRHGICDFSEKDDFWKAYFMKLRPSSRSIVFAEICKGSNGHCYAMSATVILNKLGMDDMTRWDGVNYLRAVSKEGGSTYARCYYQAAQWLADYQLEKQRFMSLSASQQLSLLAQRADQVKSGGNPVLFSFGKESFGHVTVAYALEPGSWTFSGRTYDHRVLLYDCNSTSSFANQAGWSENTCLYFNLGTGDWEIPRYKDDGISSYEGAYLKCAAVDTEVFDARDDNGSYEEYCPVLNFGSDSSIVMREEGTDNCWVINPSAGTFTGTSNLMTSYADGFIDDDAEGVSELQVVLPDADRVYTFETASGEAEEIGLGILYADKYLAAESSSAAGIVIDPKGAVALTGNTDEAKLVVADDSAEAEGRYDTYTFEGASKGDVALTALDGGVRIEGDDIRGATVIMSNTTSSVATTVEGQGVVEFGNEVKAPAIQIGDGAMGAIGPQVYTGEPITPEPKLTIGDVTLKAGVDYEVAYSNNVNAGTATVIVTGKGAYTGMAKGTFTIKKAKGSIVVKAKLKKAVAIGAGKPAKASKLFKVTKKTGKVTYELVKVSKAARKYIKMTKSGKVKVKKGAKKGVYTIKVKATSAATRNYKAASTFVTLKIKVK